MLPFNVKQVNIGESLFSYSMSQTVRTLKQSVRALANRFERFMQRLITGHVSWLGSGSSRSPAGHHSQRFGLKGDDETGATVKPERSVRQESDATKYLKRRSVADRGERQRCVQTWRTTRSLHTVGLAMRLRPLRRKRGSGSPRTRDSCSEPRP